MLASRRRRRGWRPSVGAISMRVVPVTAGPDGQRRRRGEFCRSGERDCATFPERTTGYTAVLSFGSTGQLFTQITQDAPFEVFLAADQETPRKAVAAGLGLEDSVFTYAVGKIVLFSTNLDLTMVRRTCAGESLKKLRSPIR